mgnify:CR=1 FL=1
MGKIKKLEEINRKKNEHVHYSEEYEVNFWIQKPDGFWEKKYEMYFAKTKGEHEYVYNRWKEDYKGKPVKYISTIYQ